MTSEGETAMEAAHEAMKAVPMLAGLGADDVVIERLGGLTNLVYRIEAGAERYVLRVAGKGTEEYIDRAVEMHNARLAAEAGVSAELLYADAPSGLMVTRYLDGTETMSPESFRSSAGAPARAARAFKQLHDCGREFRFRFELFAMIDDYLALLDGKGAALPDDYHDVVAEAEAVRRVLDANPTPLAPCHCDPLCENLLDDGARMWIVDWEYSGMNDPIWDLGDLSVEAGFEARHDREMTDAYCGGAAPAHVYGRMVIYKAMCDLLWTLWGLIQHANENPAEDFWAYAVNRFERCKTLMGEPDFARHLAAIGR